MDVTCPRCQTDYEFDDALVSERGTTVKCTNCGHQFRVFRPRVSQTGVPTAQVAELWRIERREGEPLELRSLVELQRAIRAGRISRQDMLRRGDGPLRRVGDIPELEPFFPAGRGGPQSQHTLPLPSLGNVVQQQQQSPQTGPRVPAHTPAYGRSGGGSGTLRPGPPPRTNEPSNPGHRSNPPTPTNLRTPLGLSPYVPAQHAPTPAPVHDPHDNVDPPTLPMQQMSATEAAARLAAIEREAREAREVREREAREREASEPGRRMTPPPRNTPLPPPRPPPPHRSDAPPGRDERVSLSQLASELPGARPDPAALRAPSLDEPEPPTQRRDPTGGRLLANSTSTGNGREGSREELYESLFPPSNHKKSGGAGKWIVALLVVGGLVAAGATVGRPYIMKLVAGSPPSSASSAPAPTSSPRLQDAVAAGDRARTEGDFVAAREAYLRATVIDEKSMAAWDGFCAAETELAIAHWIASLITGSSLERDQAASLGGSAARTCARWVELMRATEDGTKKASDDLRSARALAAQGDAAGVRLYLPTHAGDATLTAMVTLVDASKQDTKAVEAAAKQVAPQLGKVALTSLSTPADLAVAAYVAAVGGPPHRAQDVIDELVKRAPKHLLLDTLKQLVSGGPIDAGPLPLPSTSVTPFPSTTSTKLASGDPTGAPTPKGTTTGPGIPSGDYRDFDKKGHEALAGGDASKAETYFRAALAQQPGDVDALFGLGQIERSRGNHVGAIGYFKQVLEHSPGFGPARLALADEQWATGAQGEAVTNYKAYLEQVPTGSGADRARARTGQTEGTTTKPPDPAPTE